MLTSMNIVYLLFLTICTVGLLYLLHFTQLEVFSELEDVLLRKNNPAQYFEMLKSKRLGLILRKGSLALLELNGYLYTGNDNGINTTIEKLQTIKLNSSEKLSYMQKKFNYYLMIDKYEQARQTYNELTDLLKNETNMKIIAILDDAKLLLGIYADSDVTLIPQLQLLEKQQIGTMQGITQYRLAKLYWSKKDTQKSLEYLNLAESNLHGTKWEPIINEAKESPDMLSSI